MFPSNSDATGLANHSLRIPELEKKKSGGKGSRKKTKITHVCQKEDRSPFLTVAKHLIYTGISDVPI